MKIRAGDYRLLSCETFGALVAGFAIVGLRDHCRAIAWSRLLLFLEGWLRQIRVHDLPYVRRWSQRLRMAQGRSGPVHDRVVLLKAMYGIAR